MKIIATNYEIRKVAWVEELCDFTLENQDKRA